MGILSIIDLVYCFHVSCASKWVPAFMAQLGRDGRTREVENMEKMLFVTVGLRAITKQVILTICFINAQIVKDAGLRATYT